MKFAYIGTYVPRECGIGTFTQNLFLSMTEAKSKTARHEGIVVAMDDNEESYDYPEEVTLTIRQQQQGDYIEAASFINLSMALSALNV